MTVEAIIGPQKSTQAIMVSQIGNKSQVPVISFSATSPTLSSLNVPYFARATINDTTQVKTITSLIKAYGWREVVPIYEDTDFGRGIIPNLADSLQEIDVRIPYQSFISISSTNDQIQKELYKLQTMQTRVFIVHMSSSMGSALFLNAKNVGMMSEGYVWIMTNGVTNMMDSFDSSVIRAMSGALGVRLHVPETEELKNFTTRWKNRFQENNPQEISSEPSIYVFWAYDTIYALAMAVENISIQIQSGNSTTSGHLPVFPNGPQLLQSLLHIKFPGLSGNFELIDGQLQYSAFEIINVIEQGIRHIGYWREKQGLSKQLMDADNKTYSTSLQDLNPVIWPGETIIVPKGWAIPVSGRKLRVGVVSSFSEFIQVDKDPLTGATKASGYAVDVFEQAIKKLPYSVPFEYQHFGAGLPSTLVTYNDFVFQVYLGNYDVAIGDITIRYNRTLYVDFSMPYTDSGVAMIVPVKKVEHKNASIFFKPFSFYLWLACIGFVIFTGIIIWILEPKIRKSNHLGVILQLSLFAYQREDLHIYSRIVAIVSAGVLLILTSSYTANLSSMLTVQNLQPTVTDINDLIKNGDYVGYEGGSFIEGLLLQHHFEKSKIRSLSLDNFAQALDKGSANGGVAAIVDEVPYIKLFLAKHCSLYTMIPIHKSEGFGFAFKKGSPLVSDISLAILNMSDGNEMMRIEKTWIEDQNCQDSSSNNVGSNSLNFHSFWELFTLTGAISISLFVFAIILRYKKSHKSTKVTHLESGSSQEGNETVNPSPPEGDV
ncbi:glutamate receptor 2.2 [Rhynchospora pubera]|uniref:Glutamate receptor n=1 Tax=Rhynchospora pubera TaxID=906938 RepID=A0AAV8G8M5_9POAL|nr:glutamate receptor 2.2 [Rhynchospora pubera]